MSKYKHNSLIAAMGLSVDGMESLTPEADTVTEVPEVIVDAEEQALEEAQQEIEKINTELMGVLEADANHEQSVAEAAEAIAGLESMFQGEFDETVYRKHVGVLQAISERTEVPLPVSVEGMESLSSAQIYLNTMSGLEGFMDNLKSVGKTIKEFIIQMYRYLGELISSFIDRFKSIERQLVETQKQLDKVDEIKREIVLDKKWNQILNIGEVPLIKVKHMTPLTDMAKKIGKVNIGQMVDPSVKVSTKAIAYFKECITNQPEVKFVGLALEEKTSDDSLTGYHIYELAIGNMENSYIAPQALNEGVKSIKVFQATSVIRSQVKDSVRASAYTSKREISQELQELITYTSEAKRLFEELKRDINKERDVLIAMVRVDADLYDRDNITAGVKAKRMFLEINESTLFKLLRAKTLCIRAHF